MSYSNPDDFYDIFDQYLAEFTAAPTFAEFCGMVSANHADKRPLFEYLAGYQWVPRVYQCAKLGKRTLRALEFPEVNTFAELFHCAVFAENGKGCKHGYKYLSGSGAVSMHVGGIRSYSPADPAVRSHFGAKFFCTYAVPRKTHYAGYEAIRRTDGILILGTFDRIIGSDWLALLPLSESVESLFDEPTRALIAAERSADVAAWGKDAEDAEE